MEGWKGISGMLTIEFTSAEPEKILDRILRAGIPVSRIKRKNDLTYSLQIPRNRFKKVAELLRRSGSEGRVIREWGWYPYGRALRHRPVLILTAVLLFLSALYLPSRVFFISVEGNVRMSERELLSAAEDCGIRFGALRKSVRSEKVKNALLSAVPQLQWAGINTSGCTAVISVRERAEEESLPKEYTVSNLVADRDGYILSATVTGGTAQCMPGDTVTKGQILISGYTDCGICIRASRAEGEILAQTNRNLSAVMPDSCVIPVVTGKQRYNIGLLIGKKRINLWKDSRICKACCGRIYTEYFVSLPGGFQLPAAVCIDRYVEYELQEAQLPEEIALMRLPQFSDAYLLDQTVAGQILEKQQHLSRNSGRYQLDSDYRCTEMIGREQREQIGVINGKRN